MGCSLKAQSATNRFSENGNSDGVSLEGNQKGGFTATEAGSGLGNPTGDSAEDDAALLPIDDYIPLLALTALGIIIYTTQKKRNLLS